MDVERCSDVLCGYWWLRRHCCGGGRHRRGSRGCRLQSLGFALIDTVRHRAPRSSSNTKSRDIITSSFMRSWLMQRRTSRLHTSSSVSSMIYKVNSAPLPRTPSHSLMHVRARYERILRSDRKLRSAAPPQWANAARSPSASHQAAPPSRRRGRSEGRQLRDAAIARRRGGAAWGSLSAAQNKRAPSRRSQHFYTATRPLMREDPLPRRMSFIYNRARCLHLQLASFSTAGVGGPPISTPSRSVGVVALSARLTQHH